MPKDKGEPLVEPSGFAEIERQLTFMQFKPATTLMLSRCVVRLRLLSWTLETTYLLGLHRDQDPDVLFEILGNSRFTGFPPTLTVNKEPDRLDGFFQIAFESGTGAGGYLDNLRPLQERMRLAIQTHARMYELTANGLIGREEFAGFIGTTYAIYEAC